MRVDAALLNSGAYVAPADPTHSAAIMPALRRPLARQDGEHLGIDRSASVCIEIFNNNNLLISRDVHVLPARIWKSPSRGVGIVLMKHSSEPLWDCTIDVVRGGRTGTLKLDNAEPVIAQTD